MTVSKYSTADPDRLRRYLRGLNFYTENGISSIMFKVQGMGSMVKARPFEDSFIKVTLEGDKWKVVEK